jgi:23S rRNA (pseudouridine1915-N3)-methyltransferase
MKITFLQTGKTTDQALISLVEDYASRIRKYAVFEIITIPDLKDTRKMPVAEQKAREAKKILAAIASNDFVVLLDERGKEMRSIDFASWLQIRRSDTVRRTIFITGGPWGFDDEVYRRANFLLSLSKMTLPHQLVRLLFTEQLYRAFSIIRKEPYHHE